MMGFRRSRVIVCIGNQIRAAKRRKIALAGQSENLTWDFRFDKSGLTVKLSRAREVIISYIDDCLM